MAAGRAGCGRGPRWGCVSQKRPQRGQGFGGGHAVGVRQLTARQGSCSRGCGSGTASPQQAAKAFSGRPASARLAGLRCSKGAFASSRQPGPTRTRAIAAAPAAERPRRPDTGCPDRFARAVRPHLCSGPKRPKKRGRPEALTNGASCKKQENASKSGLLLCARQWVTPGVFSAFAECGG